MRCSARLGSNCIISLLFTPAAASQRVANLMIADDASGSPQTVALSGTGLAPAASCAVSLVFSPVSTGQTAAMLTVTNDAPGSPQSASISGMAVAAFSVAAASGSSTSASVSAGQPAQYQLQFTWSRLQRRGFAQ